MAMTGGDRMQSYLEGLRKNLETGAAVKVGFLEGATYPDGQSVAQVAAVNEFGGVIEVKEGQVDVYRKLNANGEFAKSGRFVKRAQANFVTTHHVEAHTITIPARPFFKTMIFKRSGDWGRQFGKILKAADYNTATALALFGELAKGQLQQSIREFADPANAASTVRKKGFNKPLIETGHMLNSVDYEVLQEIPDGPA